MEGGARGDEDEYYNVSRWGRARVTDWIATQSYGPKYGPLFDCVDGSALLGLDGAKLKVRGRG